MHLINVQSRQKREANNGANKKYTIVAIQKQLATVKGLHIEIIK
jgi:hypothetical protein